MLRIGVTRHAHQLRHLTERAADKGVEIVPLPLLSVEDVPFKWPQLNNGRSMDWIAFSSPQGVLSFFSRLSRDGKSIDDKTKTAVIGGKTAEALSRFGFKADFLPSQAYGRKLFEEMTSGALSSGDALAYPRAEEVTYDPAELLSEHGIQYFPIVCYRMKTAGIDPELISAFDLDDGVLFTAPSAVRAYHRQFGILKARAIAIGRTTAEEMEKLDWSVYRTMNTPDVDTILEYV